MPTADHAPARSPQQRDSIQAEAKSSHASEKKSGSDQNRGNAAMQNVPLHKPKERAPQGDSSHLKQWHELDAREIEVDEDLNEEAETVPGLGKHAAQQLESHNAKVVSQWWPLLLVVDVDERDENENAAAGTLLRGSQLATSVGVLLVHEDGLRGLPPMLSQAYEAQRGGGGSPAQLPPVVIMPSALDEMLSSAPGGGAPLRAMANTLGHLGTPFTWWGVEPGTVAEKVAGDTRALMQWMASHHFSSFAQPVKPLLESAFPAVAVLAHNVIMRQTEEVGLA
jgi:hypothetical protein